MKVVAEIVAAIIFLFSGYFIAPKMVKKFKMETINKIDQGIPPISFFNKKLKR
jgi:uncharacterized protein YneF (UPF0154 family)